MNEKTLYDPEEFGNWLCPICDIQSADPNSYRTTCCSNGHSVILGPTDEQGRRDAVPQTYLLSNGKSPR